jgi:major membrane immunogen (membrane-anchored lipoprotein)
MRSIVALPLAAAVLLTACDSGDEPKSVEEVKQEMAGMVKPRPGLYRSTSKVVSFEVPGMPAAQAERMKQMFSTTEKGTEFCLTPQEADKGFEEMTKKLAEGNCTYDRFETEGDRLDAKLTCETGEKMKATIEMKGTMGAEGSQMTMSVNQTPPGVPKGGAVKMVAEVASRRVGDCPRS